MPSNVHSSPTSHGYLLEHNSGTLYCNQHKFCAPLVASAGAFRIVLPISDSGFEWDCRGRKEVTSKHAEASQLGYAPKLA